MTSLFEILQPANPLTRSSSIAYESTNYAVVRIIRPYVQVRNQPGRRLGVPVCQLHYGVFERLLGNRIVEKQCWLQLPIGWICSTDESKDDTFEIISDMSKANYSWEHEEDKRRRMASAVVSMLVKSYSLPQVKRLVRGIVQHTNNNYPHKPMLQVSKKSIEDIMISLGGETHLTKSQVFEYIKVAAAQQSDPSQSVIDIVAEIAQLVDSRPSHWVVGDLNIIETEEVVRRNNKFVMAAASGDADAFKYFVENSGIELTSLHTELKYTALHAAADFGKHEIIKFIIQTGFSLDVRDPKRGQTALHFAAYNGREEVIRVLLLECADRHIKNHKGLQPYEIADRQGHFLCREMLKHIPPLVKNIKLKSCTVGMIEIEWSPPYQNFTQSSPILEYFIECTPVDPTVPRNYVSQQRTFTTTAITAQQVVDSMCIEREDVIAKAHSRSKSPAATTAVAAAVAGHNKRFTARGDCVHAATAVRFAGLTAYSEYSFRIKCRSLAGWSIFCVPVVFATRAFVPDQLDPAEIVKISTNGIALTWHPPLRENGFPVDHYQIELIDSKGMQQQQQQQQNQETVLDVQQAAEEAVRIVSQLDNQQQGFVSINATAAIKDVAAEDGRGLNEVPNRRISAAALRRKSTVAEQGGLSKYHRLLTHKYLDLRFKYLTGLEPYRQYHVRVRAHNQLGYGPWSEWTAPVAPAVGVTVKEFKSEQLTATLTWFQPLLSCGRSVQCYEVQLCVMRGPVSKSVQLLTSAEYVRAAEKAALENQSVCTEEKIAIAEADGDWQDTAPSDPDAAATDAVADAAVAAAGGGSGESRGNKGEDLLNEYVTISSNVTNNYLEVSDLKAGGRYKCRVRAKVLEYEDFYDWDKAVVSSVFSMAPTPPDPPLHVRPSVAMEDFTSLAKQKSNNDGDSNGNDNVAIAAGDAAEPAVVNDAESISGCSESALDQPSVQWPAGDSVTALQQSLSSSALREQGTVLAVQDSLTSSVKVAADIDMNETAELESAFRRNLRRTVAIGQKISNELTAEEAAIKTAESKATAAAISSDIATADELTTAASATDTADASATAAAAESSLPPQWEITHDSITITWNNGLSNGLPVDEFCIQCAKVRTYRVQDVIRARDAFHSDEFNDEGMDSYSNTAVNPAAAADDDAKFPIGSNELIPLKDQNSLFWDFESLDTVTSTAAGGDVAGGGLDSVRAGSELLQHRQQQQQQQQSQQNRATSIEQRALDSMQWEDITYSRGCFLGPQKFRAFPLAPGATYIFRVQQRNALGWSKFSRASRMITTFPSVPPGAPEILSIQRTYVLLRWPVTTLTGGDVSKPSSAVLAPAATRASFEAADNVTAAMATTAIEAINDEGSEQLSTAVANGLTQLDCEVQIAIVDASTAQSYARNSLAHSESFDSLQQQQQYQQQQQLRVDVRMLEQIPSGAWRDAEVRDMTFEDTLQLLETDRHYAVAMQRTESGSSLIIAQSTSQDDVSERGTCNADDLQLRQPAEELHPASALEQYDDHQQIQRINALLLSHTSTTEAATPANLITSTGTATTAADNAAAVDGSGDHSGFVYKMLQRLAAGTTFVLRVRVRTVVGWSPWSALSRPFRTLS